MTNFGQNPKEDIVEPLQNIYFINDISSKLKEKKQEKIAVIGSGLCVEPNTIIDSEAMINNADFDGVTSIEK